MTFTYCNGHFAVAHEVGCAGIGAGAITVGFISGVLLTAAIAGVIALVVLCRAKRRGTAKPELVLNLCICMHIAALTKCAHAYMYYACMYVLYT